MSDQYHLEELRIARDPQNRAHVLPPEITESARVLDVGCGAGQILSSVYSQRAGFGLDYDFSALRLGRSREPKIPFVCGKAEELPFRDATFDLVVARVSLAYTNIPASLREIHRVLKSGGSAWMTLHPFSLCWNQAKRANWKGRVYFGYIVLNSLALHLWRKQFTLFGRQESFQTEDGMRRALKGAGFQAIRIYRGGHFLVTARRAS